MIKPQESKVTFTNGSLRGCQECVNKVELSKKYTDIKIKPLCSKKNCNMISNTDLEEIDEYLQTQDKEGVIKEDRKNVQKVAKK